MVPILHSTAGEVPIRVFTQVNPQNFFFFFCTPFIIFVYVVSVCVDTTATANRYRPMERGHSGRKDLSVPRYGRKFSLCFLVHDAFFLISAWPFVTIFCMLRN